MTVAESAITAELVQDRRLRGMAIANAGAWLALAVGGIATTASCIGSWARQRTVSGRPWPPCAPLPSSSTVAMFGAAGAAARFRSDPDGHALTFAVRCSSGWHRERASPSRPSSWRGCLRHCLDSRGHRRARRSRDRADRPGGRAGVGGEPSARHGARSRTLRCDRGGSADPGSGRDRFRPGADAHDGPCRCCGRADHRPCRWDPAGHRDGPTGRAFVPWPGRSDQVGPPLDLVRRPLVVDLDRNTAQPRHGRPDRGSVLWGSRRRGVCSRGDRPGDRPIRAVCAHGLQLSAARPAGAVDVAPRGPAHRGGDCAGGARLHGRGRPGTPDPRGMDRYSRVACRRCPADLQPHLGAERARPHPRPPRHGVVDISSALPIVLGEAVASFV